MAWDAMGDVMVVAGTSGGESISLRVLGERMETGWEHRTLCKKRRRMGTLFPKSSLPSPPQSPAGKSQLSQLLGRTDEGTQFLQGACSPERAFV